MKDPSAFQITSAKAGLQPKWNMSWQLVPDGLNDRIKHLEAARELMHPAFVDEPLHPDLEISIERVTVDQ